MGIVKIQRVGQSARILPMHVKEGDIRGKSTRFYILVSGRPRSQELRDLVSFPVDKTGPRCNFVVRDTDWSRSLITKATLQIVFRYSLGRDPCKYRLGSGRPGPRFINRKRYKIS